MGVAGMAENGDHALQRTALGGVAEGVEAATTDKTLAGPGAIADEVDAARDARQGEFR